MVENVTDLSDEQLGTAALLWQACHRHPDPEKVTGAIRNGADVALAARLSVEQGIGPLLWRTLDWAGSTDALGVHRQWLSSVSDVHLIEAHLLLPKAVSSAVRPLADAGLEPVVLKGPALAARYPAPGLRPMGDIDLLLPKRSHREALASLTDAGWRVVRSSARDHYDTVMVHDEVPSLALELHYGLEASHERVTSLDPERLWRLREPIDCLGVPAFGLPVEEEIVVLAAHAGKPYHGFSRLVWIADLAMVVGHCAVTGTGVDWDRVRSVAHKGRCTTVVGAALGLSRHAGVEFPSALFVLPRRGWRAAALRPLLDPSWPLLGAQAPTFHLRYALTDGLARRGRLLVGSGHGMPASRRVGWSAAAPAGALARWWQLRHSEDEEVDVA